MAVVLLLAGSVSAVIVMVLTWAAGFGLLFSLGLGYIAGLILFVMSVSYTYRHRPAFSEVEVQNEGKSVLAPFVGLPD